MKQKKKSMYKKRHSLVSILTLSSSHSLSHSLSLFLSLSLWSSVSRALATLVSSHKLFLNPFQSRRLSLSSLIDLNWFETLNAQRVCFLFFFLLFSFSNLKICFPPFLPLSFFLNVRPKSLLSEGLLLKLSLELPECPLGGSLRHAAWFGSGCSA